MSRPPCAACKYSRRRCTESCLFAPHFPPNKYDKYKAVHKVFGASHVFTLLNSIHPNQREEAINGLIFEAEARLPDPVCGCTPLIVLLERQLQDLQALVANAKNELALLTNNSTTFVPPPPPPPPRITFRNHNAPMMADHHRHLTPQELHEAYQSYASTQALIMREKSKMQREMPK